MFNIDRDNNVVPMVDTLLIPEFKFVWDKDLSTTKRQALKELGYVYFMCSHTSPYVKKYGGGDIETKVNELYMMDVNYKPPQYVKKAMAAFRSLYNHKTYELFETANQAVSRLNLFISSSMSSDKLTIDEMNSLIKLLGNVPTAAIALQSSQRQIEEELTSKSKGIVYTKYEIPSNMEDFDLEGVM